MGSGNPMEIGGNKMITKKDDHYLIEASSDSCKQLNIGKKKKFTIVEGIKLFGIMSSNNPDNLNKSTFWANIEKNKLIPGRTADQMKKFWQKNELNTVEQWLVKAIHENTDFSFSIKKIPSDNFEYEFRKKYEIEFLKVQSLEPTSYDRDVQRIINMHDSTHSSAYPNPLSR